LPLCTRASNFEVSAVTLDSASFSMVVCIEVLICP
jgi:hypothetical protein